MDHLGFWIALAAILAFSLGMLLISSGIRLRRRRGLGGGESLSVDRLVLSSHALGLIGQPDRIIRHRGTVIIEEWKSSARLWPEHRLQLGVYFLLVEDQWKIRPPHGFVVTKDGRRHRIENTPELRDQVLAIAADIRHARRNVSLAISVDQPARKCRGCGQLSNCGQAKT